MEFSRGLGLRGKELQLMIEATEDRIFGLQQLGLGNLTSDDCLPDEARCSDGSSSLPGFKAIMLRAIQRSVARVENKIKLSLYPRRKTNFAQTPKEVYEDRVKYGFGGLDSFITPSSKEYPTWSDLSSDQQAQYNNDSTLYSPGTLPWDLLTQEQKEEFAREVIFVPNKIENEERIDGKGRSYIKLYERYVTKIHKLALEIQDPQGLGIPYLNRTYAPNEYFLYQKEGAVILFPAQAKISATGASNMIASSGYGLVVPNMPQIIAVDYEFGLKEIPQDLQDAVALYSAIKTFELVNIAFTKGMMSYSVQGFSAAFGKGLYADVMQRYKDEADELLHPYYQLVMTGY
jgi:hypothetical protein